MLVDRVGCSRGRRRCARPVSGQSASRPRRGHADDVGDGARFRPRAETHPVSRPADGRQATTSGYREERAGRRQPARRCQRTRRRAPSRLRRAAPWRAWSIELRGVEFDDDEKVGVVVARQMPRSMMGPTSSMDVDGGRRAARGCANSEHANQQAAKRGPARGGEALLLRYKYRPPNATPRGYWCAHPSERGELGVG